MNCKRSGSRFLAYILRPVREYFSEEQSEAREWLKAADYFEERGNPKDAFLSAIDAAQEALVNSRTQDTAMLEIDRLYRKGVAEMSSGEICKAMRDIYAVKAKREVANQPAEAIGAREFVTAANPLRASPA